MEYDHMAELGLTEDKQLICSDVGFITRNDPLRDLCCRFVRDGGKIYDVLSRYDMLISYALSRDDGNCGSVGRLLVPILKACGVTDKSAYDVCAESLRLMKGVDVTYRYLGSQLPTFFCTETYEHQMLGLAEKLDIPLHSISCNMFSFDELELPKPEARAIREALPHIASCMISQESYITGEAKYLTREDSILIDTVDAKLVKLLAKTEIMEAVRKTLKVSGNEKAYGILELCRKNEIAMSETAVIGCRNSDFPSMDIVRDSSGLALAFNASEYAVRGANVAVISDRPIVAAVLVNEFYNGGIESVHEMIKNWDIEKLKERPCADRNLVNELIAEFPSGLPEVFWITKKNLKKVIQKSNEFRKKLQNRN